MNKIKLFFSIILTFSLTFTFSLSSIFTDDNILDTEEDNSEIVVIPDGNNNVNVPEDNGNNDVIPDDDNTNEEDAPEVVDFTKMTVNCLGDSLTYGSLPSGARMENPYPKLLQQELGFAEVNNFGVGGSKVANEGFQSFISRYVMFPDADIVIVMGGTNDSLSFSLDNTAPRTPLGTPEDTIDTTFYGALDTLCRGLLEKYPDAFIMFVTPLPIADSVDEWTQACGSFSIEDGCEAVKVVCSRYNIPVFDAYNETGYDEISNIEKTSGTGDGIHPNQEFWSTDFAPKLAQFIVDNYE